MNHAAPIALTPAFLAFDFDQFVGLALVAGLPALFWTALAFVACASFGIVLSFMTTAGIAVGIGAFLTMIFRAVSNNKG